MVKKKSRLKGFSPFQAINGILLILLSVVMLYPFVYIFAIAFNDSADTLRGVSIRSSFPCSGWS